MSSTANILFVLNSLTVGGTEIHAVTLLNKLDTSKFSLSLLYLRRKEALLTELNQSRLNSISCYGGTNCLEFRLPFYLARHIEKEKIDTVVCFNQRPMLYAFLARPLVRHKFRIIEVIHVAALVTRYQKLKNFMVYKSLFKRCDRVIFVCKEQQKYWLTDGLMDPDNTKCIYNGIDFDRYNDDYCREAALEFRRKLGFGETAYVIGICARLHTIKKHTELITALETLRLRGIDAKVFIIGDGPERGNLESFIRSKSLEQHVVISGFQKDIRPFIAVCDCIALTSAAEVFPLSTLEAMAMGKPVISSDVGGAREQIQHGVTGFLYNPGDTEQLVTYLEMMSDPILRATMGKKARQVVCDEFSLGLMIREYTGVLEEPGARTPPYSGLDFCPVFRPDISTLISRKKDLQD